MTADIIDTVVHGDDNVHPADDALAEALIAHLGLSQADVARITEAMHAQRLSFDEAARHLNLATQKDTADVKAWLFARNRNSSGVSEDIFERAVHKIRFSNSTALTVRQGSVQRGSLLQHTNIVGHPRNEQISSLSTDLLLLNSAQRSKPFAFVSPGRNEGRSQLCAELAIAFARL